MILTKAKLTEVIEEYWRITPYGDTFLLNINDLADKIMEAENREQKLQNETINRLTNWTRD